MILVTDPQIAIIYYGALFISLSLGIIALVYLKPNRVINKIMITAPAFWRRGFGFTTMASGLLSAVSISYYGCKGGYRGSFESTINLGIKQLDAACFSFMVMFGIWFLILMAFRVFNNRATVTPFEKIFTLLLVIAVITLLILSQLFWEL